MSDILERIKAEDKLWRHKEDLDGWQDKDVGKFVEWYRDNRGGLNADPMFTSHLIRLAGRWRDPEKLDRLWVQAMLEGGDDDT